MFDNIMKFFKKFSKGEKKDSKETAKERLHLVLMQDRANVSADFMELMKQEIIEVIKKYIDVDENSIDVKLTNKVNGDGTTGAPILYANIPILNVKDDTKQLNIERKLDNKETVETEIDEGTSKVENKKEETLQEEKIKEQVVEQVPENKEENKEDEQKEENKEEQKNKNKSEGKEKSIKEQEKVEKTKSLSK